MRRLIIYYNFIIVSVMVLTGLFSAQNFPQLISASLFFPLFVYFAVAIVPKTRKAVVFPTKKGKVAPAEVHLEPQEARRGFDINRRAFLKVIGSAGVGLFMMTIFTKRAEAAFFGSVPGPGTVGVKNTAGALIDPAEKQPTDGYKINQLDDTSSATYSYYGFTNKDGAWFIMRETTSGVDEGQYRYRKGSSGFPAGWGARADNPETYDYFDVIFD